VAGAAISRQARVRRPGVRALNPRTAAAGVPPCLLPGRVVLNPEIKTLIIAVLLNLRHHHHRLRNLHRHNRRRNLRLPLRPMTETTCAGTNARRKNTPSPNHTVKKTMSRFFMTWSSCLTDKAELPRENRNTEIGQLTPQAQRVLPDGRGARDATMATATLPPGSLQRMVRPRCHTWVNVWVSTEPVAITEI